jgi:L,D-transpeptidase catalytic domain
VRRTLLVVGCLAALLAACAHPSSGAGFDLPARDLERPPTTPPPDPWLVRVATARPEVPAVVAYRRRPATVRASPAAPGVAQPGGTGDLGELVPAAGDELTATPGELTPIPSATLAWDSTAIEGGWSFDNPTAIGNPRTFVVTEIDGDWLEVMVPVRPNHQEGWIRRDDVTLSSHRWHAEINVTTNTIRVWEGDELRAESGTVDGKPSTPTPLGRFYFNELQKKSPSSVYGSFIISTNGFSDSLERFSGEVPIFAIHGTNNEAAIGTDVSNGCVRLPNPVIEQLAAIMPMGTPLDVVT